MFIDMEYAKKGLVEEGHSFLCSFTAMLSQKSSTYLTTCKNWFRFMGLVM